MFNIVLALLRIKVAAVLLGPAGVGLIGLLTSLVGTASAVAGMGIATAGTRQIAGAAGNDDATTVAAARRALFWGTLVLAPLGGAVVWVLRDRLAEHVLADASMAGDVGWLALAVALTVAAASQSALFNGMRLVGDLARVSILSTLLSTLMGVGALLLWGRGGLMVFVVVTPLASFLLGQFYVTRLPKVEVARTPLPVLTRQWRILAGLGVALMLTSLAGTMGQLLVRALVQGQLGADALGFFQAASSISMAYIGIVLSAMSTNYYASLSAAIHDHSAVNRMVNEQTEVALLLAGPFFLAMMGLSPWVIEFLFTDSFHPAAYVLRWLVLSDVLKLATWPLGFIILAAGHGRTVMLTESLAVSVLVLLTWAGLPLIGLKATGIAFVGMYMVYLPMLYLLGRQKTGFKWTAAVKRQFGWLIFFALTVWCAAEWSKAVGAGVGLLLSFALGLYSFGRLAHKTKLDGPLGHLAVHCRHWLMKIGVRCD